MKTIVMMLLAGVFLLGSAAYGGKAPAPPPTAEELAVLESYIQELIKAAQGLQEPLMLLKGKSPEEAERYLGWLEKDLEGQVVSKVKRLQEALKALRKPPRPEKRQR